MASPPSDPNSSKSRPPRFDPAASLFDLDTFRGRLSHFLRVLDPRTLFTPTQELQRCDRIIQDWRKGIRHDDQELWDCKAALDACTHPVSKEAIPVFFRMAAFTPVNIPIVLAMMNASSPTGVLFVHWLNQTYNSAVNLSNRSGGGEANTTQMLQSYLLAVVTSCSLALGLGKVAKRVPAASPALFSYIAVSAAGTSNIMFSRQNEFREGAPMMDATGKYHGHSLIAGKSVVLQTAVSRGLIFPLPVLLLPHAIMQGLGKLALLPKNPRLRLAVELAAITGSLAGALPVCMSLFPQTATFKATELEPQFQNVKDGDGRPISSFQTNKGL